MFKDEYRKMNEAITPGSELLERTERSMAEIMNKKDAKRMSAKMAAALALVCALALTGVALAAGVLDGVFARFLEWRNETKTDVNRLNELAGSRGETASWDEWDAEGEVLVELNQAYYDGYQLITGAKYYAGSRVVLLDADDPRTAAVRPGSSAEQVTWESEPESSVTEDGMPVHESGILPEGATRGMREEDVRAIEREYAEKGEAYFMTYWAHRADWIQVEGDESHSICPMIDDWNYEEDGAVWRYTEYGELPEKAQNQDELDVTFLMHVGVSVWRVGGDGVWKAGRTLEDAAFTFTVERGGSKTESFYGAYENDVYSVRTEVRVSELNAKALIDVKCPAEWVWRWDGEEIKQTDFIRMFYVVQPDGEMIPVWFGGAAEDGAFKGEAAFALCEGQTEVRIRPWYSVSGYHEDEDIVISLENGGDSVK